MAITVSLFSPVNIAFTTINAILFAVLVLVAVDDTYQWGKLKKN